MEKFKFVLDYKIKELKKQIEPRENEIKAMKEQIQDVRLAALICFICLLFSSWNVSTAYTVISYVAL